MKNRKQADVHTHGLSKCEDGVWRQPSEPISFDDIRLEQDLALWYSRLDKAKKAGKGFLIELCQDKIHRLETKVFGGVDNDLFIQYLPEFSLRHFTVTSDLLH